MSKIPAPGSSNASTNPLLFIFATWLVLAWKIAGYYGLDSLLLPALGVPGHPGKLFAKVSETPAATRVATT